MPGTMRVSLLQGAVIVECNQEAFQEGGVAFGSCVTGVDGVLKGARVEDQILDGADRASEDGVGGDLPAGDVELSVVDGEQEGVGRQLELHDACQVGGCVRVEGGAECEDQGVGAEFAGGFWS